MMLLSMLQVLALLSNAEAGTFEGQISFDDFGQYILVPFDVPEGATAVTVSMSVETEGVTGDELLGDILTFAVYDTQGYRGGRGWGATIAADAGRTTDGYLPGRIPAGEWKAEIGAGLVNKGHVIKYKVEAAQDDTPVGEVFTPPAYEAVVINKSPGWYKGDLHMHSVHSDGCCRPEEVFDFARSRGLDFAALTDHNSLSHLARLPDYQARYDDLLLIRGIEVTSFRGHANVFGTSEYVDYHATAEGYDLSDVLDEIQRRGAVFSINHNGEVTHSLEGKVASLGWTVEGTDYSEVDAMELVNGPSGLFGYAPNPVNENSMKVWDEKLGAGLRITGIGGSDDHQAGKGTGSIYGPVGTPTTVVYADELSEKGILDGIKRGSVFVMADGPDGTELYITAKSGAKEAMAGGELDAAGAADMEVRVKRGKGATLKVFSNGMPLEGRDKVEIPEDDFTYKMKWKEIGLSAVRAEVRRERVLKAIVNPVYVTIKKSGSKSGCSHSGSEGMLVALLLLLPVVLFRKSPPRKTT